MRLLFFLIIIYSLILGSSQVALKSGINQLGKLNSKHLSDIWPIFLQALTSWPIMIGILFMVLSFFLWFYILSLFKLSLVFPLSSITFVVTVIMAAIFLGEGLTICNVIGTLVICAGVFILLLRV
ncbi:hypothetical protein A2291_00215 [candidate division WOR-1 bacterium RIFOXYB2_FULL_42_35]|uniref:Uncharacterized protein n=1 Tax=candidate division WOR-1 bacterium RIFOXYC2_FULL_41_25 TaxID=1802586 RepID=A0A1F4TMA6_UNCSA|nr:MAG: hypothetical protein A2247_05735 [candidate division WOR-1 bacterium RIFOXYA2_FULL_41_14]OGC24139.1 MAG: hypothetical protein A2291_00215 [candidate division WOR-1 bacterium RIFOXYB2_FULL_42_35]OGC33826.1 MAG: hypothetical protein A2462_01890 [candidate division WOR-1 bacterium RIFOXYC2_FULL_41_25]OGC41814.1 MAG: hypothetical protein A2548_03970 [candidate division WOR-1 bacterium RIFOXYD2_FULL_41_8]